MLADRELVVLVLTDEAVVSEELPNPLSVSYSNWHESAVESVLTDPLRVAIHGEDVLTEVAANVETTMACDAVTAFAKFESEKDVGDPERVLRITLSSSEA